MIQAEENTSELNLSHDSTIIKSKFGWGKLVTLSPLPLFTTIHLVLLPVERRGVAYRSSMTDRPNPSVPLLAPATSVPEASTSRSTTRKKASTACTACRARRSRCTGGVPCLSCISHRTDCVKDESEDGRRRIAIKRRLKEYEDDRHMLDGLVMALKHGDETQMASLLNLVRTNTSRHDLGVFLEETLKAPADRTIHSPPALFRHNAAPTDITHQRRPRTGGIGDLINPPVQVPAKPWTTVTDDDDFVSHLVSLWFTWTHPWFRWIEADVFIEAMQTQDISSPFCKPYLVNCILAQACLLDAPDTRENSFHTRLREKFMSEAEAGINAEQGRDSLTMVQALGVQWISYYLNGEDRVGRLMLNSQVFLAKGLGKWRAKAYDVSQRSEETTHTMERCLDSMDWTLFTVNAFNLADYRYFHSKTKPDRGLTTVAHTSAPSTTWYSYPLHRRPCDFHPDCHFRSLLSLAEKSAENEEMSALRERGELQVERQQRLVQALQDWPNMLPACMQIHAQAMPHVLVLHTLHSWVFLVLAKQAAAAEAGQPGDPIITSTPSSQGGLYWQRMSLSRAVTIAGILRGYIQDWSADYFPPMILQPISLALLTLLEDLETEENRAAFVQLSKTLQAVSKKYRLGRGVMRVIQTMADEKDITLPAEAEHAIRKHGRRASEADMSIGGSSPRDEDESGEDDDITMAYLLEKWGDLKLNDDLN